VQVPYKRQFPWSWGKLLEYLQASGFISFATNKQVVEEEEEEPSRKRKGETLEMEHEGQSQKLCSEDTEVEWERYQVNITGVAATEREGEHGDGWAGLRCRLRQAIGWAPAGSVLWVFFLIFFYSNKGVLVTLHHKTTSFWVFHPFSQFQLTDGAIL
jgi:hypothetical protein